MEIQTSPLSGNGKNSDKGRAGRARRRTTPRKAALPLAKAVKAVAAAAAGYGLKRDNAALIVVVLACLFAIHVQHQALGQLNVSQQGLWQRQEALAVLMATQMGEAAAFGGDTGNDDSSCRATATRILRCRKEEQPACC